MPALQQTEPLSELLHRVFGHRTFRAHQQKVCEAAAAGRDVLLVMPTGAGKSLCYQLPALARGGTALVISPLIALMDDQASKLSALGLRVARVHSGLSRDDSRQACRDYLAGALDFLFIAPERMRVPGFPEMLAKRKPALVAIDEAHCISAWGHDFRPDYRTLGQYLPALRPAPIIALTATATPTVQRDIAVQLDLRNTAIFITGFRRDNLAIQAIELSKPQRPDFALKLLKDASARPAIIYAGSRKQAEELATTLHKHFPTAAYHAGLDPATRDRVQRAFLSGKLDVVVATVAFGMGVDKADVRTVIHVALPGSVEAFYQEIGRAGRDGLPSRTVLLHGFADRRLQEFFLAKNYPPTTDLERVVLCLPADFTPVDVLHNALRKKKDMIDRETLDRTLEKLLVAGVALMDMSGDVRLSDEKSGAPGLASETWVSTAAPRWQDAYESQVAIRRAQIDRMVAFAESTTCRMAALVQHFGDTSDKATTCGLCDICNPSGSGAAQSAHQPTEQERAWLREILSALEHRSTSTGKLFTDLHLKKDNKNSKIDARRDFDTLLDGLARAGLLTFANDTFRNPEGRDITYKKVAITHEGRTPDDATLDTVWLRTSITDTSSSRKKSSSKSRSSSSTTRSSKSADQPLNPAAEQLFEQLRNWRTEQAKPNHTPAFMILSDTVLRAIANTAPQNLTALHAVPGMGPTKVDRFGADLIAICRGDTTAKPSASPRQTVTPSEPKRDNPVILSEAQQERTVILSEAQRSRRTPTPSTSPKPSEPFQPRMPIAAALSSTSAVHPNKRAAPPPPAPDLTSAQLELEARLKDWRREEAKQAGLPTFFIFSDTVLRNITLAAPTSIDDLRNVRGTSPDKLGRFGTAIIDLCAKTNDHDNLISSVSRKTKGLSPMQQLEQNFKLAAEDLKPLSMKTAAGRRRSRAYDESVNRRVDFEDDLRQFAEVQSQKLNQPAPQLLSESAIAEIIRFRPSTLVELERLQHVRADLPKSFTYSLLATCVDEYKPERTEVKGPKFTRNAVDDLHVREPSSHIHHERPKPRP
jgi:ATP-dependent DNA helicase RecQ